MPYFLGMIPFEDIDKRLAGIGKNRKWLAETSGKSESAIRSALAKSAPLERRSASIQKALSDAIAACEREQAQKKMTREDLPTSIALPFTQEQFDLMQAAAICANMTVTEWMIHELNMSGEVWKADKRRKDIVEAERIKLLPKRSV